MDDLKLVREIYGETVPDPRLETRIRAELVAETLGTRSARRRVPLGLGGLGLVAAAVAVALVVTTLGGAGSGSSAPSARPTELSARTILLAAAEKAAAEPGGRYWRLHTVGGATGYVEDGAYTILGPGEFDNWQAKSEKETDTVFQRELAAHPLTAADKAAWQRAGSPATFKVRNNADWVNYTTRDGQWRTQRITPAMKRQAAVAFAEMCKDPAAAAKCARGRRTWAEREKLAADPKTFQQLLFPKAEESLKLSPANKLQQGYNFLIEQPASPAIRAKAFRILADLPGVRYVGRAKSPDGRVGIAVAARGDMIDGSGATFEYEFFLDPKTYKLLGEKQTIVGGVYRGLKAGTLLNQQSVLFAGWTSASPRHN